MRALFCNWSPGQTHAKFQPNTLQHRCIVARNMLQTFGYSVTPSHILLHIATGWLNMRNMLCATMSEFTPKPRLPAIPFETFAHSLLYFLLKIGPWGGLQLKCKGLGVKFAESGEKDCTSCYSSENCRQCSAFKTNLGDTCPHFFHKRGLRTSHLFRILFLGFCGSIKSDLYIPKLSG